jgi:translation initiation factor 3 subunit A
MRVDHRAGTISLGAQSVESDRVRSHLASVAKRLAKAVTSLISPLPPPLPAAAEARRVNIVRTARETLEDEHNKALSRKVRAASRTQTLHGAAYWLARPAPGSQCMAYRRATHVRG